MSKEGYGRRAYRPAQRPANALYQALVIRLLRQDYLFSVIFGRNLGQREHRTVSVAADKHGDLLRVHSFIGSCPEP